MNSMIAASNSELSLLCKRYHVRRLELFGSATKYNDLSNVNDLDFLVDFADLGRSGYGDAYFGLLESLQRLFNKPVDLVMLSAVKNPYLLESIEKSKTTLYAA